MRHWISAAVLIAALALSSTSMAETNADSLQSISTPAQVQTQAGTLHFNDGMPDHDTLTKVYDHLDFSHAYQAFLNTMQGVNAAAARRGLMEIGIKDNEILIFSKLMDANSLFLTANADTIYFIGFIDLTQGPMVFEAPPQALGTIDDMWWHWVIDFGKPGPDRGEGGKYLLLPPDYKGIEPEGGFYIARARTYHVLILGRMFLDNDNPKPVAERIRNHTKVYPYSPGGIGTSIAAFLDGKAKLGPLTPAPTMVFHEGSGRVINTIPPNDYSFFTLLNETVQKEPAESLDPELAGSLAAIGIIKGKPFNPDARMKKILTDAVALGNATSRSLLMNPRDPRWYYYPNSAWMNFLFISGYEFETPIPVIEGPVQGSMRIPEGVKLSPPTGYRTLNERSAFFYGITGITPAMAMRMTGIGSQYLIATLDAGKHYFDGGKTYKITLPKGIPQKNFWSLTLYDNQTRSMLATPQHYPRAGSQNYPSPSAVADADGSTTIYIGPTQPAGVQRGNWIQTVPGKGWFVILRLYGPLEPFFSQEWRPSEITPVL